MEDFKVGDQVMYRGKHRGTVRFIGAVEYARGQFMGIELDEAVGKNNGTVKDKQYFVCAPKHGVICREYDVDFVYYGDDNGDDDIPSMEDTETSIDQVDLDRAEKERQLGNELFAKKDWTSAIAKYTTSIKFADNSCIHLSLGNRAAAYLNLERYVDALADCERALSVHPDYEKCAMRRAKALKGLGKFEAAISAFKQYQSFPAVKKNKKMFKKVNLEIRALQKQKNLQDQQKQDRKQRQKSRAAPTMGEDAELQMMKQHFRSMLIEQGLPPAEADKVVATTDIRALMEEAENESGDPRKAPALPAMGAAGPMPPSMGGGGMGGGGGMAAAMLGGSSKPTTLKLRRKKIGPLQMAARKGDIAALEAALAAKAEVDEVDCHGMTALEWAAKCGHLDIVMRLLKAGATVDPPTSSDGIPTLDDDDTERGSALIGAAAGGHLDVVRVLAKKGDLFVKDGILGQSALHQAVLKNHFEVMRFLVEEAQATGGQAKRQRLLAQGDNRSYTPLAVAAGMGRLDMVRWLASQGAPLTLPVAAAVPSKKNTAKPSILVLHGGAIKFVRYRDNAYNKELRELLESHGANAKATGVDSETMLHLSAHQQSKGKSPAISEADMAKWALSAGVDANIKDNRERTALHVAARNSSMDIMQHLLKAGADANLQDAYGDTALHVVGRMSDKDAYDLLRAHGASEEPVNLKGKTPVLKPPNKNCVLM